MHVVKDKKINPGVEPRKMTPETMQNDLKYELAQKLTKSLHKKGLISVDELHKISALNRKKFCAFYGDLFE